MGAGFCAGWGKAAELFLNSRLVNVHKPIIDQGRRLMQLMSRLAGVKQDNGYIRQPDKPSSGFLPSADLAQSAPRMALGSVRHPLRRQSVKGRRCRRPV
jgi:hypothetical protein